MKPVDKQCSYKITEPVIKTLLGTAIRDAVSFGQLILYMNRTGCQLINRLCRHYTCVDNSQHRGKSQELVSFTFSQVC